VAGFPTTRSANDEVDLVILTTLAVKAADWLVTQDVSLRRRATKAGFGDRVFALADVVDTLDSFLNKPTTLSTVQTVAGYEVNLAAPIFTSLRKDYPEFDDWWRNRVALTHRDVLVLGPSTDPEGIAVLKVEDDHPHGLPGRVLKICTFKRGDEHQGSKRGELLLRAAIDFGRQNTCERVYLEVLPSKQSLLTWLTNFGFSIVPELSTIRNEHVSMKVLVPSIGSDSDTDGLRYNVAYGPGAVLVKSPYLVPIRPHYHHRIFPEAEIQSTLFPRDEACGNAIRKAYLCHARTRSLQPGDVLLFFRTGGSSSASAVGVVENTHVARRAEELAAFVGNRTVYSIDEMRQLCDKDNTLAILFRLDRILTPRWPVAELRTAGVLTGHPQSIQRIREDGIEWIRERLAESP